MGAAIILGVVFVFLVVILAGLLRGLDWDELRRDPSGPLSVAGVRGIVGGGFLVGLAYGLLVGSQSGAETWRWLSRGVVDGLVVACAGAFYVGFQQRKRARAGHRSAALDPERAEAVAEDSPGADPASAGSAEGPPTGTEGGGRIT